jgi:hypothetical protein
MEQAIPSPLVAWETFYVIVGSSGAALTGLQFVVIALIAESKRRATSREIEAFGTPTIIHFCAVLLVAAILSAPWRGLSRVSLALAACGLAGVVYGVIVVRRARRQTTYQPVFEDWLFHAVLPFIAYVLLIIGALALRSYPEPVLFLVGMATLLLLFIGIHNAWDTVTYITIDLLQTAKNPEEIKETEEPEEDELNSEGLE